MGGLVMLVAFLTAVQGVRAQSALYERHFDLSEVTLLDGPMKDAMEQNVRLLLSYDMHRLLTPFVREAGLSGKAGEYQGGKRSILRSGIGATIVST